MEKNVIKEEIVEILEVIIEQSEVINNYQNQVPQIEIDIILSNIRELYGKFRALEKENKTQAISTPKVIEDPVIAKTIKETKIIIEPELVEPIAEIKTPTIEDKKPDIEVAPVITKEKEEIIPEPVKEEKVDMKEEPPEIKTKNKKFSPDLFSSHNTVADKFKDEKQSLNEKHTSTHSDKSLASKLQRNPVKDLKAAIGINEKFKFINELFEGSLQKYNESIALLNGFAGSEAALKYMSFLKDELGWKDNNEAYHELDDLVKRRYNL